MKPYPFMVRGMRINEIKVGENIYIETGFAKVTKIVSVKMVGNQIEVIGMCKEVEQ